MILKILAQNVLDGFGHDKTADKLLDIIATAKPDVAVFPEAYKADNNHLPARVITALQKLGYQVTYGVYDEADGRKDRHGTLVIVRQELADPTRKAKLVRIGGRNIAEAWLIEAGTSNPIHFLGMHLNDRSEAARQAELDDVLQLASSDEPTIIAGDLNSLHRADAKGKMFRRARLVSLLAKLKLMPVYDPMGEAMPNNLGRKGSIYTRLHQMASGKTVKRLEAAGFRDADEKHQPTFRAKDPFAQLDHILLSPHFRVQKFTVLSSGSSDHRGIIAEVTC